VLKSQANNQRRHPLISGQFLKIRLRNKERKKERRKKEERKKKQILSDSLEFSRILSDSIA
jgi:hypothetical protein